ncbi:MAG: UDP-N-acetylmuramoyl-L-alanyl-D-glutamate--2,6-diaminopimelate ligase [Candidatus Eremiobacteraeota bacterium]|nr:UDP-N-acetylmuramoyl-L-alanyl-D-glutamate--2,6-diaminopimelate ligase [Candidatus Eremiobacteraeota bacterium]
MAAERHVALTALLERVDSAEIVGSTDVDVGAVTIDSRNVEPRALFVALRGSRTDGHHFVRNAVGAGARVVVVEELAPDVPPDVTTVRVSDTRRALSAIAAAFYGDPSHDLAVVGITGTNGKTTTAHMAASILNEGGVPCGITGTVGAAFGPQRRALENTTPLPPVLHELLAAMRDDGAKAVAMEVSSHALALDRVNDVRFAVATLTNVARDHLDFHGSQQEYAAVKRRLFTLARACVLNADDAHGARWAAELREEKREVITYGLNDGATLVARDIVVAPERTRFAVGGQRYELLLPGRFNVSNALAAIGIARFFGIDDAAAARGLSRVDRIPGRMERLAGAGITVVVDYAHTPDALENALRSLRETARGALAVVFGCGGDRDRGKRPEMGAVASRFADRVYLTNDNPRGEEPQAIVDAIVAGTVNSNVIVELDRERAIARAIAEARAGDVVLVAGKGHEPYQIVGDRVLPFDDVAAAREALTARVMVR